jgi:chromosome condensin MukBEF MukE localization factor
VDKPGVKAHWFECNVYETEGKRFVVHLAYRWAGRIYRETNQDYVDDFATLQEISGHLDTFVARDCVVGFPEGDYWAEKQAALLAQVDSDFDALAEEVESGLLALYAAPERVN